MYRDIVIQACIEACVNCELECERCSTACLMDANPQELAHCIQLNRDCANVCALAVKYLAHNSDYAQAICETAVEICVACRDECARHDTEACRRGAIACHEAAEECERIALQPVP